MIKRIVEGSSDQAQVPVAAMKGGMLAKLSGMFCADKNFRTFLMRRWPDADQIDTAQQAAAHVKMVCEVESRKEFDNDAAAESRFHDRIRIPYANWNMGRDDSGEGSSE